MTGDPVPRTIETTRKPKGRLSDTAKTLREMRGNAEGEREREREN